MSAFAAAPKIVSCDRTENQTPFCPHPSFRFSRIPQELILEHTAVGDAGVLHATRGLPLLRTLSIANYASSLGQLAGLPGGPAGFRQAVSQADSS